MTTSELPLADRPHIAERAFTVLALLFMTGAFMNLTVKPGAQVDQANGMLGMQIAWTGVYVIALMLLSRHCQGFGAAFFSEIWLVLLLALAVASIYWSDAPAVTFRRSVALVGTSLFGFYFATRYDLKDQLKLLSQVCWIAVVGSFIFGLLGVGTSVDQLQGVWYGLFVQRNGLGRMMVLCAMVFSLVAKIEPRFRLLSWLGIFLALCLIVLSKSQTALVSSLFFLAFQPLCGTVLRGSLRRLISAVVVGAAVCTEGIYLMFIHLDLVTGWLHRDITFSGRLYLWILGVSMALHKPWQGYGYSAFWLGTKGASIHIWRALNWSAPNGHNGLLDLWLDLGLVGVAIFLMTFARSFMKSARYLRKSTLPEASWPFLFLIFLVFMNLTESSLMETNSIFWALYVAVAYGIALVAKRSPDEPGGRLPFSDESPYLAAD